ncbi:ectoine/hydroxyectoine ABC transporter substrate-binding protein EhuB [Allopusillimonas soli]|uniref:Ectoine/hydroxyectoine ABC transporter substrate-binding protein EhuB n=1 Tax=Allopusillimonas soli TaxID=659016 RepID=A0A853FGH8_9BURK|nr:ectoine/hydroxyectoine ABC transporter substrate-binding protein EhuB [Allopusillimonas soli]NYT37106.1 ectoine/hydroxyectoine ABC transporter substrate-binding protein EhuB [Allopusillimonas soli]TEA75539.1 ectoine/hydroxyectoine ABC transporter substrate-binding protein EhuB [Allopusillimonas soli]
MLNIRRTTFIALAALLTGGVAAQASAASLKEIKDNGTIRIAVANEIPYGYMDMNGQAKGAGPDVAKHIMEQLGIKNIKWVTTNFGSLIPGLRANRFDMVAAEMAILPQRCKEVLFSEPNSSYGEGLLVAKGNPDGLHSYDAFAKNDKKIAIMAGADQLEMLQKLGVPGDRMVTISSNADAISTVSTGRAAGYAATSLTVAQLAAKSDKVEAAAEFEDPVVDGKPVRSWGGFTFSQDSGALRDAVNAELAKFKKTPEWQKILTGYGFSEHDAKASFDQSTKQLCTAE